MQRSCEVVRDESGDVKKSTDFSKVKGRVRERGEMLVERSKEED